MGYNIAGVIIKKEYEDKYIIETLLERGIEFSKDVDFESATSSFREENTVDIFETKNGILLIFELGHICDLTKTKNEIVQFMVSDVSDTYYFEKYSGGKIVRKLITSQGEIAENIGEGIINESDSLIDIVWNYSSEYLQNDFMSSMFDIKFKRFNLK